MTSEFAMTAKARPFMSGRSQAIRLPAKLRIEACEVVIEQIGNSLWVQPQAEPAANMGAWLKSFYDSTDPLPADFLAERQDVPARERDWT